VSKQVNRRERAVREASANMELSGAPSLPARKRRVTRAERQLNAALERDAMVNMGLDDPCLFWGGVDNIGCK